MKPSFRLAVVCLLAGAAFGAPDQDRSLSFVFESIYFNGHTDPLADPDGDGIINYDEMIWGTNPTNALSKFTEPAAKLNGSDVTLNWPLVSSRLFELHASEDMAAWHSVATGYFFSYAEHLDATNASAARFFRLTATLDTADSDGNGLADWEENLYQQAFGHSLDTTTDTDGDGLPDQQELLQGQSLRKRDHPAVGLAVFTPLEK